MRLSTKFHLARVLYRVARKMGSTRLAAAVTTAWYLL